MYNIHLLKIISSELHRKSKILSSKQVAERKLKNLAHGAPCSSPLPFFKLKSFILSRKQVPECNLKIRLRCCRSLVSLPDGPQAYSSLRVLQIQDCDGIKSLPPGLQSRLDCLEVKHIDACYEASVITESSGGVDTKCRSAFPALRKLHFFNLSALEKWGAAEGTPGEEVTFPLLEELKIDACPKLTGLPETPKLGKLAIEGEGQQISLQAASRCIPSLSKLILVVSPDDTETTLLHVKQKWDHELPLAAMMLTRCDLLFSSHPGALALWTCFARLVDLTIRNCDALVYWPENVFPALVSLRSLSIRSCSKLTGHTQASDGPSAPERGGLPPRLESLDIGGCTSLVEVPNLPASLTTLGITSCSDNIKSIIFGQHENVMPVGGEGVVQPDTSSLILGSSGGEATTSTAVLKLSSAANHRSLPGLKSLSILGCHCLSEVANLPPSIKILSIQCCGNLQSLSGKLDVIQKLTILFCGRLETLESCVGELRSLEKLGLFRCGSLVSLPDGPQAYSSLRYLQIGSCDGIKLLPWSLRSRLDCLEEKDLDARYEEPKTLIRAMRRLVDKAATRLFPCSQDEESDSD